VGMGADEQGQAQAQANDGTCTHMPATSPVLTALSAVLDTPTCHDLHLISPSNNFNILLQFIAIFKYNDTPGKNIYLEGQLGD